MVMQPNLTKHHWITDRIYRATPVPRYAPVAPPAILHWLFNKGQLPDYHLLLAHDVVKPGNRATYRHLFRAMRPPLFTILDNSLIELGVPCDTNTMIDACNEVRPDVVVLPDKLGGVQATYELSMAALNEWYKAGMRSFAVVLQGANWVDIEWLMDTFQEHPEVTMWCVPRHLTMLLGTRRDVIRKVHAKDPTRPIHLLGFSDDFYDDMLCVQLPGVVGIDSAVPIRAAIQCGYSWKQLKDNNDYKFPRENYWGMDLAFAQEHTQQLVLNNLKAVQRELNRQYTE